MNEKLIADRLNEEKVSREASVALFNALGPKHVATARAWMKLADALSAKDETKEAGELYAKALPVIEKHHHNNIFTPEVLHILNKLAVIHLDGENEIASTSFFLRYFDRLDDWFEDTGEKTEDADFGNDDAFIPISDVDVGIEETAYTTLLANQLLSKLIIMALMFFPMNSVFYQKAVDDFIDHFDVFDMFSIESAFAINTEIVRYLLIENRKDEAFLITYKLLTSYLFFSVENGKELLDFLFSLKNSVSNGKSFPMEDINSMERSYRRHRKPWSVESLGDFIHKFLGSTY
jgi:hypothetical protein